MLPPNEDTLPKFKILPLATPAAVAAAMGDEIATAQAAAVVGTPNVERDPDHWFTIPNRQAKRKFRRVLRAMRRKVAHDYDKHFRPTGLPVQPDPNDAHVPQA